MDNLGGVGRLGGTAWATQDRSWCAPSAVPYETLALSHCTSEHPVVLRVSYIWVSWREHGLPVSSWGRQDMKLAAGFDKCVCLCSIHIAIFNPPPKHTRKVTQNWLHYQLPGTTVYRIKIVLWRISCRWELARQDICNCRQLVCVAGW